MTTTETYTGASCSGSSFATSRVLTLANTALTVVGGFNVFLDGQLLTPTSEYTVSHLATSSTITFVLSVGNSSNILVNYDTTTTSTGSFVYTNEANVYLKSGLTSSELNLTTNTGIILDSEAELEMITGRKFTNANSITEYIDGAKKDVLGISGQKTRSINTSFYPIQSITELKILNVDGTTSTTYDTLSSAEISAGTYDSDDYWAEAMEDPISRTILPYGRIVLKEEEFPVGVRNVKISYTHGYSSVPHLIQTLATTLSAIRMWVAFLGGQYNRLDSYSIPQQTVSKGSIYIRGRAMIQRLKEEANQLLDRIGRRKYILFAGSGQDR